MKHRFVIDVDPGDDDVAIGGSVDPSEWETHDLIEALSRLGRGDHSLAGGATVDDYTCLLTPEEQTRLEWRRSP